MKRSFLFIVSLFSFSLLIHSQTIQQYQKQDSFNIVLTQKTKGFGPNGSFSRGMNTLDKLDSARLLAFPKLKGIPDTLKGIQKYYIIMNYYQFDFQNYKKGIYSKENFLEKVVNNNWDLSDTIFLSINPVRNVVFFLAGYNSHSEGVYIIDANNNYDFSDDTLRHLYQSIYNIDDVIDNSHYVDYEFFDGKMVRKDKILLSISNSSMKKSELQLFYSLPEYYYSKIKYEDKIYLICKESYDRFNSVYVLEDKPYFTSVSKKFEIKPKQYLNLGNDYYSYFPDINIPGIIKLKRVNISKDNYESQVVENIKEGSGIKPTLVSNQVNMVAPPIEGLNIVTDSVISLKKYAGKYIFIDFWATYCVPCIQEFPNIRKAYDLFDKSNFEIIGIVNDQSKGKIKQFLIDKNVVWQNISMLLPTTNVTGYKINSFPRSYLIGPDGKIIATDLRGEELVSKLEMLKVKKY
jgi:thiol-disulfide isomerase/thioredoxin